MHAKIPGKLELGNNYTVPLFCFIFTVGPVAEVIQLNTYYGPRDHLKKKINKTTN